MPEELVMEAILGPQKAQEMRRGFDVAGRAGLHEMNPQGVYAAELTRSGQAAQSMAGTVTQGAAASAPYVAKSGFFTAFPRTWRNYLVDPMGEAKLRALTDWQSSQWRGVPAGVVGAQAVGRAVAGEPSLPTDEGPYNQPNADQIIYKVK
jgi:hypothetical protein